MRFHLPKAAYVHIPFCLSKCHYCDFNSYAGFDHLHDTYVSALILDIEHTALAQPPPLPPLETVYFGGGTPTVLRPHELARVSAAIKGAFGMADDAEVTVEANPDTVTPEGLHILRSFGFNRISIGAQTFASDGLGLIGRRHTASRTVKAVADARAAGFTNVGLDLIFGLPGENIAYWRRDLKKALQLRPEHLSVYELSFEEGTPFGEAQKRGEIGPVAEEESLEMYETAIEAATVAGYEHYEVSNFALPGFRSRHNTVYWHNKPYYGFGAGAAGFVDGVRFRRLSDPAQYVEAIELQEEPNELAESLSEDKYIGETMMLRLRLLEGIDINQFSAEYGVDLLARFRETVDRQVSKGLVELVEDRLKLTHKGLLLLNEVVADYICG